MPRITRGLVDGLTYHVLNRGNGKQRIFHKELDYKSFISLIKESQHRHPVKIFAYCIMPNHFHMVLQPVLADNLSRFMQWLMTSHVRRYHRHYGTSGHIWQGRFKSFIIQEDNHLITVLRYVEGNPVRANLVSSAEEWPWSSSKERMSNQHYLLSDVPVIMPTSWENYVNRPLTEKESEDLRICIDRQSPYGATAWKIDIAKKADIESTLRPRGRPKKEKL